MTCLISRFGNVYIDVYKYYEYDEDDFRAGRSVCDIGQA